MEESVTQEELLAQLLFENDRLHNKLKKRDSEIRILKAQLKETESRLERLQMASGSPVVLPIKPPTKPRDRIRWSQAEREIAPVAKDMKNDKDVEEMIENMFTFDELSDLDTSLIDANTNTQQSSHPTSDSAKPQHNNNIVVEPEIQIDEVGDDAEDDNPNEDEDDYDYDSLRPRTTSNAATSTSDTQRSRLSAADADKLATAMADALVLVDTDALTEALKETTVEFGPTESRRRASRQRDSSQELTVPMREHKRPSLAQEIPPVSLRERVKSISVSLDAPPELEGDETNKGDQLEATATNPSEHDPNAGAMTLEQHMIEEMRDAIGDDGQQGDQSSLSSPSSSKRTSVDLLLNGSVPPWLAYHWCTSRRKPVNGFSHPLAELCTMHDYAIIYGLTRVVGVQEIDELARQLMRAFEGAGMALELLERMIKFEVADTRSATTLFRSNSLTSKLLSVYSRMIGKSYLQATLGPIMRQLKQLGSIEVDPNKSSESEAVLGSNLIKLMGETKKVLDTIFSAVQGCPSPLRRLSAIIRQEVEAKFPGFGSAGIAGFLFLRFICPAIVAPEAFGFVKEPPPPEERRIYILVCKVLQNLANGVKFGAKERFMLPLNSFLEVYEPKLTDYFQAIVSASDVRVVAVATPRAMVEESIMRLGSIIEMLLDKLAAEIQHIKIVEKVTHSLLDALQAVLREFPPEIAGRDYAAVTNDFTLLSKFEEVLIMSNSLLLRLLLATCASSKDLDSVCKAAIHVLSPRNKTLSFVMDIVSEELNQAENVSKFCESQTLGFRLLAAYIITMASGYLRRVLRDVVVEVCATDTTFESLDTQNNKKQGGRTITRNMDALVMASYKFFGCIVNSLLYCPSALRRLCYELFQRVKQQFNSKKAASQVLAQVLFLRFFCPAIASPQAFQLVDKPPSEKAHRALVVISYSLKHLAAGTTFKDPQMAELNSFLRDHTDLLQEFIVKIASTPSENVSPATAAAAAVTEAPYPVSFDVRARALLAVRSVLSPDMMARIASDLTATAKTQTVKYKLVDRLAVVLVDRYHR